MMKKFLLLSLLGIFVLFASSDAYSRLPSDSEVEKSNPNANRSISDTCGVGGGYDGHCGIWICLPGGFPESCRPQKKVFDKRLDKTIRGNCHSPVPRWSACSASGTGTAKLGKGFAPCKQGFKRVIQEDDRGQASTSKCVNTNNSCEKRQSRSDGGGTDRSACKDYNNPKKWYVDMEANGTKYPRSYFNLN